MNKVYFGGCWDNLEGMAEDFGIPMSHLEGREILIAYYCDEDYCGSAYVLYEFDGILWEVHGGHCSCHGLESQSYGGDNETQWEPECVTLEYLEHQYQTNGKAAFFDTHYSDTHVTEVTLACARIMERLRGNDL